MPPRTTDSTPESHDDERPPSTDPGPETDGQASVGRGGSSAAGAEAGEQGARQDSAAAACETGDTEAAGSPGAGADTAGDAPDRTDSVGTETGAAGT
ncbi:tetratricopeptide repeat protein, partial [Streptomyces sp. NPDC055509]